MKLSHNKQGTSLSPQFSYTICQQETKRVNYVVNYEGIRLLIIYLFFIYIYKFSVRSVCVVFNQTKGYEIMFIYIYINL